MENIKINEISEQRAFLTLKLAINSNPFVRNQCWENLIDIDELNLINSLGLVKFGI